MGKVGKSDEKWGKVGKSWEIVEKLEKVGKGGEKWGKVGKGGKNGETFFC